MNCLEQTKERKRIRSMQRSDRCLRKRKRSLKQCESKLGDIQESERKKSKKKALNQSHDSGYIQKYAMHKPIKKYSIQGADCQMKTRRKP